MRLHTTLTATVALATLVAGCGGSTTGDGGPTQVRPGKSTGQVAGRTIATLGDSIVAGSPQWDPDKEIRAGFSNVNEDSQWQRWARPEPAAELRNCGAWGERTDQIAQRFARCTQGADAVIVQGGINDIVQQRPVIDAGDDLECLVDRAIRAKLPVAIIDVLPWNNGYPDAAPKIRDLNKRIHSIASSRGIPLLPFFATLEDADKPGRMVAKLTIEGDHPNVAGYRKIGEEAWREPALATHPAAATACA